MVISWKIPSRNGWFGGTSILGHPHTRWCPIDSVQLVYNYNFTRVYDTYNYSFHGVYKPTNITGGAPPCRSRCFLFQSQVMVIHLMMGDSPMTFLCHGGTPCHPFPMGFSWIFPCPWRIHVCILCHIWLAIYHQYTPVLLAYIPYMDPMGYKSSISNGGAPMETESPWWNHGRFFSGPRLLTVSAGPHARRAPLAAFVLLLAANGGFSAE